MAISAVLFFKSDGDVRRIYDAIVDEMGVRDKAARGMIYHWCAPVDGGLRVCDVWETRDDFEAFAKAQIAPISAKHGLPPPVLDVTPVHEMVVGREMMHTGTGVFADFFGDSRLLLRKIDEANDRMNILANPPEGLVFHWSTEGENGVRVIDHWRSREDFERFVKTRLGEALHSLDAPEPTLTFFEVYNTIDRRVAARV